jgi:hypothetical protein
VGKWVSRYQARGAGGLLDSSSRPHRSPRRLASSVAERVLELRRGHMPGYEIARRTGISAASVSRLLRRARLSRWRDLNPPPPIHRYEHPAPGDLLHLDIKGMTRFGEVSLRGRWEAARQARASRLPRFVCGCGRPLAHDFHPDAARSEGRHHHRLPALRGGLFHPPRYHGRRPAYRQRLELSLPPIQTDMPADAAQTPPHRTLHTKTTGNAERFIRTALREWA